MRGSRRCTAQTPSSLRCLGRSSWLHVRPLLLVLPYVSSSHGTIVSTSHNMMLTYYYIGLFFWGAPASFFLSNFSCKRVLGCFLSPLFPHAKLLCCPAPRPGPEQIVGPARLPAPAARLPGSSHHCLRTLLKDSLAPCAPCTTPVLAILPSLLRFSFLFRLNQHLLNCSTGCAGEHKQQQTDPAAGKPLGLHSIKAPGAALPIRVDARAAALADVHVRGLPEPCIAEH